jgi:acetyl esterase/lipase
MKHKSFLTAICILLSAFCISISAQNQPAETNKVIRLYNGIAPGSETWDWKETNYGPVCFNVVEPTLTVFETDKSIANGMAVVIAPGGAYHFLMVGDEGEKVAKWLNAKGITAFVLKYRLGHLSNEKDPFSEYQEIMATPFDELMIRLQPLITLEIADGRTAVKYVRTHAAEYGLATDKIGLMGFSAGGTVTAGVSYLYENAAERPDFAAPIYPAVSGFEQKVVPVDAPPMFIAAATDDDYHFNFDCTRLYNQWTKAGKSAELHIYRSGKHGFALKENHIPTDKWIDRFYEWLIDLYKITN